MRSTIKLNKEAEFQQNFITELISQCVKFWNREGDHQIEANIKEAQGNAKTQNLAKTLSRKEFLLQMVLCDCQAAINSDTGKKQGLIYEVGRSGSHIWVHNNQGQRIIIIH